MGYREVNMSRDCLGYYILYYLVRLYLMSSWGMGVCLQEVSFEQKRRRYQCHDYVQVSDMGV